MKRSIKHPVFKLSALSIGILLATNSTFANEHKHNKQEDSVQAETKQAWQEAKKETKQAWQAAKAETRDVAEYTEAASRNAWLDGKLETAYLFNRHLNNFTIDTKVKGDVAYLSGNVDSEIDKSLAEQVALSIEGISSVENMLNVDAEKAREERKLSNSDKQMQSDKRSFAQRIEDMTTTATVKTKLLANDSTGGMDVNVDTMNAVVTLNGKVSSSAEKALVEQIASNTDDVRSVNNSLQVSEEQDG